MGTVLWHLTIKLAGLAAEPHHSMDWMSGLTVTQRIHRRFCSATRLPNQPRHGKDQPTYRASAGEQVEELRHRQVLEAMAVQAGLEYRIGSVGAEVPTHVPLEL